MDKLSFIKDQDNWPRRPFLSVVNRSLPRSPVGVIYAADLNEIRLLNLWDSDFRGKWDTCEVVKFSTVEDLVEAGWGPD